MSQERKPDQLVLLDDMSGDGTVEVARGSLVGAAFDVRVSTNHEVLGPARNFEAAIASTDADVIVLSDQDDVWEPGKLRHVERAFADPSVVAFFSDATLVDASGQRLGRRLWPAIGLRGRALRRVSTGHLLEQLLRWNVVTGATLAFRSSLLPIVLPIPSDAPHDAWIALVAVLSGDVRALPEPLVQYRIHGHNVVGVPRRDPLARIADRRGVDRPRSQELRMVRAAIERCGGASPAARSLLADKESFLAMRASLAASPLRRGRSVGAAAFSGRYHRLAHGWRSALYDLVFGS